MGKTGKALGIDVHYPEIDEIHAELATLVVTLAESSDATFVSNFARLVTHTETHFAYEEKLMRDSGFPHTSEHFSGHYQMLNEMKLFMCRKTALSRAYVLNRLPERFKLHIIRMDSLLAAWLRNH